jgi:hypothetical protein
MLVEKQPSQGWNGLGACQFFAGILEGANDELATVQPSLRDSKAFCRVPGNKLPGYFRCVPPGLPMDTDELCK